MGKALKIAVCLFCVVAVALSAAAEILSYDKIMDFAREAFREGNYPRALRYFQIAQILDPSSREPADYINLIKRIQEGALREQAPPYRAGKAGQYYVDSEEPASDARSQAISGVLSGLEYSLSRYEKKEPEAADTAIETTESEAFRDYPSPAQEYAEDIEPVEEEKEGYSLPAGQKEYEPEPEAEAGLEQEPGEESEEKILEEESAPVVEPPDVSARRDKKESLPSAAPEKEPVQAGVVKLGPDVKDSFPLPVELTIDEYLTVKGVGVKRFLSVDPKRAQPLRIDDSTVKIAAQSLGPTFIHVWDSQGRWTFKVRVVPRRRPAAVKRWQEVDGFKFSYNTDWRSYYEGSDFDTLARRSLSVGGSAGISGPTPYGEFDSSVSWARRDTEDEVTGYSASLTKGRFLNFRDFTLRGFDFSQALSPLSFPGRVLHGVFFESPAFDKSVEYNVFYGEEKQSYYGYLSPGLGEEREAYVEGGSVRLFPRGDHTYGLNYAHGFGDGRDTDLPDKVYSFTQRHRWGDLSFSGETAFDEDHSASTLTSSLDLDKAAFRLSLRNVEKKFQTITGRAGATGEIGGIAGFTWRPTASLYVSSDLDVYRDRESYNPEDKRKLNYDWSSSLNWTISPRASLSNNFYYVNTPGLSSPQRNVNAVSTYSYNFDLPFFGKRALSTYFGYGYQRNKSPLSPSADYQRNTIRGGLRLKLMSGLTYRLSYTRSRVEELLSGATSEPETVESGLDFYKQLTPKLSSNLNVSYRDERRTGGTHSFLSGEDSMEGGVNLTYRPVDNIEIFCDGHIRRAWPEAEAEYMEADLRMGMRLDWDSFIKWGAKTTILGTVFMDANANGVRDGEEEGVEGVKIFAGPQEAVTNASGGYEASIRARRAQVSLDINTVPRGYVLTTPTLADLDTSYGGRMRVDFGISSQAGIYGVVFYDVNSNGKLDREDKPISGVKLKLDDKRIAVTNNDGVYFFGNLLAGTYKIALDVNSIPIEYIPSVAVRGEVELSEGVTHTYHFPLRGSSK